MSKETIWTHERLWMFLIDCSMVPGVIKGSEHVEISVAAPDAFLAAKAARDYVIHGERIGEEHIHLVTYSVITNGFVVYPMPEDGPGDDDVLFLDVDDDDELGDDEPVEGAGPCPHGWSDWDDCPDCRH